MSLYGLERCEQEVHELTEEAIRAVRGQFDNAEFLQTLAPRYAVISVGAMNDYGHPSDKCLQLLHQAGCTVYRTDLDGSIMLATDGETLQAVPNWDFGL